MNRLFIGGPADGHRLATEDQPYFRVLKRRNVFVTVGEGMPSPFETSTEEHGYEMEAIGDRDGAAHLVYVHRDKEPVNIVSELIENYVAKDATLRLFEDVAMRLENGGSMSLLIDACVDAIQKYKCAHP